MKIQLRVTSDQDLINKIADIAEKDRVSLTATINRLLVKALRSEGHRVEETTSG